MLGRVDGRLEGILGRVEGRVEGMLGRVEGRVEGRVDGRETEGRVEGRVDGRETEGRDEGRLIEGVRPDEGREKLLRPLLPPREMLPPREPPPPPRPRWAASSLLDQTVTRPKQMVQKVSFNDFFILTPWSLGS